MPAGSRPLRLSIGPQPVAVVLVSIAVAVALFTVAVDARRVLGWALACAVIAVVLAPVVRVLSRHLPRVVAILIALLAFAAITATVSVSVLSDLGNQFERLKVELPRAAGELEQDPGRFGDLASDLRLQERVQEVLDGVRDPRRGLASSAPATVSTYFICGILTAFLLSWGARASQTGLSQIGDPQRRERVRRVTEQALSRGRVYVLASVAKGIVAGLLIGVACWAEGLPAPVVLGVVAAAASAIPGLGLIVAGIPAIVLEAGVGTTGGVARLSVLVMVLQVADAVVIRRVIAPRSLVVGPAAVIIALVVGFEVYGLGGALYAAALAVFLMAGLDAAGRVSEGVDDPPIGTATDEAAG